MGQRLCSLHTGHWIPLNRRFCRLGVEIRKVPHSPSRDVHWSEGGGNVFGDLLRGR